MLIRTLFLSGSLLLSWPLASLAAEEECQRLVATAHPDNPPYSWRDPEQAGQLSGLAVDRLKQVARAMKVQVDVLAAESWQAARADALSGRVDLLLGLPASEAHTPGLHLVPQPLFRIPLVVWQKKSHPDELDWVALEDRRGVTLTANRFGHPVGSELTGLQLQVVERLEQAFAALEQGRADYVLYEYPSGSRHVRDQRLAEGLELRWPPLAEDALLLVVSDNSSCNSTRLQQALLKTLDSLDKQVPAQR